MGISAFANQLAPARSAPLVILGLLSFSCLAGFWLALHDIWQESGRPDYWNNEGVAAFEWRFLSSAFWVMLAFHLAFFARFALAARACRRSASGH